MMPDSHDCEKPLGIRGLLGIGWDVDDGRRRITKGPNFYLVGGSQPTHERLQKIAIEFNAKVDEREKPLEDINARELEEIVEELKRE